MAATQAVCLKPILEERIAALTGAAGEKQDTFADRYDYRQHHHPSGCERHRKADFIRFLRIAMGSSAERRTQMYIAVELNSFPKKPLGTISNA